MAKNLKMASQEPSRPRLPSWFRTKLPSGTQQAMFNDTMDAVKDNQLHTVCQKQNAPTYTIAGQVEMRRS